MRQGCNLSPLLFSLFMNDLEGFLKSHSSGFCTLNNCMLQLMMFADDLVLLADTSNGLQESINRSEKSYINWDLSINTEKTKIVIFNKPTCGSQFYIYNSSLEQVKEYKYLGITLSDKSLFKETSKVLFKQANKALFSLMKQLSNLSYPKPSLMCYLFDSFIKPVMNYGAEVWNCTILDNNDSLEIIHHKFCKFALGVSTNSTNLAVYGELGRVPISISRKVQVVKYWHRLIHENEKLPIDLREAYLLVKLKWYLDICDIFKSFGLDRVHLSTNDINNHFVNFFA